ncbi:MAG TPA: hypothetical protein VL371_07775 [Gemmataceae bacterium]|jgi:hypothetical protein|nr:hypothetical protein [Gemmataceae bacterium]
MWTTFKHAPFFALFALVACSSADDRSSDSEDSAELRGGRICGGFAGLSCPKGQVCKLDGNYPDASGHCKKPKVGEEGGFCGGIAGIQCKAGLKCVFDEAPSTGNNGAPLMGMPIFDQSGTCQIDEEPEPTTQFCGGFAGIPCPSGQTCIDDPNDSCDPANGGADCGGICVSAPPPVMGMPLNP